jgi:hypothetical protein
MPTATGVRDLRRWTALAFSMQSAMPPALAFVWRVFSLAIKKGGFIQGKATDSSGAPIYGALVFVEGANGSRYTTVTDDKGLFRILSLALGSYSVKISASAFRIGLHRMSLPPQLRNRNHYWRSCRLRHR